MLSWELFKTSHIEYSLQIHQANYKLGVDLISDLKKLPLLNAGSSLLKKQKEKEKK